MKKIIFWVLVAIISMGTSVFAQGSGTTIADYDITWGTPKAVDLHGNKNLNLLFGGWSNGAATSGYFENIDGSFDEIWKNDGKIQGGQYTAFAFGDLNGDGEIDLIKTCTNSGFQVRILLGEGDGTFEYADNYDYPVTDGQEGTLKGVAIADFNNDGLMDYLLARLYTNPADVNDEGNAKFQSAVIFFQHEDGYFIEDKTTFPVVLQGAIINVKTVDYNNDGFVDVIISSGKSWSGADQNETRSFNLFKNDGTGHFTLDEQPNIIEKWGGFDLADIDGDGWLDLIAGGFVRGTGTDGQQWGHNGLDEPDSWYYRIYKNNNGTFEDTGKYVQPFKPVKKGDICRLVDFDNDGKLDIVLLGTESTDASDDGVVVNLYRGIDPAIFSFNTTGEVLAEAGWTDFELADFDKDGKIDIATAGWVRMAEGAGEKGYITWNTTAETANTAPTTPANPQATATDNTITFSWNAATDAETPNNLTYNLALKNKITGKWMYYPMAYIEDGFRRVATPGNVWANKSWTLTLPDGTYEWAVQAIDANYTGGAFTPSRTFSIPFTGEEESGINQIFNDIEIIKTENLIKINTNAEIESISLFSMAGERLKTIQHTNSMNIGELKSGIYLMKVQTKAGEKSFKILK